MLNRFSIRTRLAANAVVACFFLALVVAVSAFGLTAGRNGLQDMTERYYPMRLAHAEMLEHLLQARVSESDMVASNFNTEEVQRHRNLWEASQTSAEAAFKRLRDMTADPAGQAELDRMWAVVKQYRAGVEQFAVQLADNRFADADGAFEALKEPLARFEEAKKMAAKYAETLESQVGSVKGKVLSTIDLALMTLAGVFALTLFLSAFMSWLIGRSVIGPLQEAVGVSERIASGNLATSVAASGRDETGRLLTSIAAMQDALRMLTEGLEPKEKVALARRVLAAAPKSNWLLNNPHISDHRGPDADLYDLLLHSCDRPFNVPELAELAAAAGLAIAALITPAAYDPATWIKDPRVLKRLEGADFLTRAAFAERICGAMTKHVAYLTTPERAAAAVARPDGPEVVPVLRDIDGPGLAKGLPANGVIEAELLGAALPFSSKRRSEP